jgi:S-formylglutathione hydrolase
MRFAVYVPPQARTRKVPGLWFLSGLTCTEENFTAKAGAQRVASELGIMLVAPDTSPRGTDVPADPDGGWDFGLGAGFYVDATQEPYRRNYRMYSYVTDELPNLIEGQFPLERSRQGISGHSMGGHGALVAALRNPARYRSLSAFAPIVAPSEVTWGQKAYSRYLGSDRSAWAAYDACALISNGCRVSEVMVEQGSADPFLETQLRPEALVAACRGAGIRLEYRLQAGYDHGYYFIASFVEEHLRWHASRLA